MIRGLYSGAAAMDVIARQQELISSNLANLNSSGHRIAKFAITQRENPQPGDAFSERGPEALTLHTDFKNGRLHRTDRALDAALVGDGFFELESPTGTIYSRSGQFYRDPDSGTLVNQEGIPVLGETGPITIPPTLGDTEIAIDSDGTISGGGQELGKLSVVAFEDNQTLIPISQSIFQAGADSIPTESTAVVSQFNQEYSNGNPVSEMISMIIGTRHYEAVQKASSTLSESLREHIRA